MKKKDKPVEPAGRSGPWPAPFAVDRARDRKVALRIEADAETRAAVARFLGLPGVSALAAEFEIAAATRGRFEVRGVVSARVTQTCVVSLDDFESDVEEPVEAVFAPLEEAQGGAGKGQVTVSLDADSDPPDAIVNGAIDLGALAVEFLTLALDPYPRKPDAAFEAADDAPGDDPSPFAALAALKKDKGGK